MTTLSQLPGKDEAGYFPVLYKPDDSLKVTLPISFTTSPAYVSMKQFGPLHFRITCSFETLNAYTFGRTLDKEGVTWWRSLLRLCATSWKVAFSIPDGVVWPHYGPVVDSASKRNENQEYFLGGKCGQCVQLTTVPPSCADCLEIWEPQPPGTLRACPGLQWHCFTGYGSPLIYKASK